jgi:hypothetical protein
MMSRDREISLFASISSVQSEMEEDFDSIWPSSLLSSSSSSSSFPTNGNHLWNRRNREEQDHNNGRTHRTLHDDDDAHHNIEMGEEMEIMDGIIGPLLRQV